LVFDAFNTIICLIDKKDNVKANGTRKPGNHDDGNVATTVFAGSFINTRIGAGVDKIATVTMFASNIRHKIFHPMITGFDTLFLEIRKPMMGPVIPAMISKFLPSKVIWIGITFPINSAQSNSSTKNLKLCNVGILSGAMFFKISPTGFEKLNAIDAISGTTITGIKLKGKIEKSDIFPVGPQAHKCSPTDQGDYKIVYELPLTVLVPPCPGKSNFEIPDEKTKVDERQYDKSNFC
jgi:hypothetical protein